MPYLTTYRYALQPYQGPASRYTCPACHTPRSFTRYLDTRTGELLPAPYGRCNREIKCGYQRSPYQDLPLERQGQVGESPSGPAVPLTRRPSRRAWATPSRVLTLPVKVFQESVRPAHYRANALARFLSGYFGLGIAYDLMRRFQLGTSDYWPGACVFWLLDEQGRLRGGQVVLYDEAGRTVKTPARHTRWVHTALAHSYQQQGLPTPAWLVDYTTHGQKSPCLFGLPQLATAPPDHPVALVESAKTAMMATYYLPQFTWLATMGLSNLTAERLRPLRGRRITLYPDAGAFDRWQEKAVALRSQGYDVTVVDLVEKRATPEERQAGLDLADIFVREYAGYPPSWHDKH